MKKYLFDYIKEIDKLIATNKITSDIKEKHLTKIMFFQHERLIHLLVTLFIAFTALGFVHPIFFIISLMLLIFLLFYIVHYFHLENGVQYLYKQYDKMNK